LPTCHTTPTIRAAPAVLVFTHGIGYSGVTWEPLLSLLRHRAAARTWNLPGHAMTLSGATDGGDARDDRPAVVNQAGAVELLRRQIPVGTRTVLVGHSFGGYLSLASALTYPELVSGVALISSGPGFRAASARADWNRYIDRVVVRNGLPLEVAAMAHQDDAFVIDALPRLACPLLHVVGEHDQRYAAGARYMLDKVPGSRLVVVPGAGHHPHCDDPRRVADAIHAFLDAID
jgi:pimeloyl-ACP methyl ester carboxylesterase